MKHIEGTFKGYDGLALFYQVWKGENYKRAITVVHGFGEHSGRYNNLLDYFLPKGYAIYSFDLRGHGRSQGKRGHINSWDEFRTDLKIFIELVRKEENNKPIFLYGHSMGGLIVLEYAFHYPEGLKGVIATGPLLAEPKLPSFFKILVRVISRIKRDMPLKNNLDEKGLSREEKVGKEYRKDPLVHNILTPSFAIEIESTIKRVQNHAKDLKIPLLLLHGEKDKIVPVEGSIEFFKKVNSSYKEMKIYPSAFHELHNEINKEEVFKDIECFIEKYYA